MTYDDMDISNGVFINSLESPGTILGWFRAVLYTIGVIHHSRGPNEQMLIELEEGERNIGMRKLNKPEPRHGCGIGPWFCSMDRKSLQHKSRQVILKQASLSRLPRATTYL
jgi:hypothetical protein